MFKVTLCIPPDYDHNYPPLGTPALSAFLKKHGINCDQTDLNLGYRDFLSQHFSSEFPLSREERLFFLKPALKKFFAENLKGRYYSGLLPRDGDGFLPYLPYDNNTNSSFSFCERLLSSEHLWRYLEDRDENTFLQFYESCGILRRLERDGTRLLGISIISPGQAIAGLTLGLMVKKALPHMHVAIGGQWPTLYRQAISGKKGLSRCFDSVITFEGETALLELARKLEAGRPVDPFIQGGEEDMDGLPCPDFDGLPLKDYEGSKEGVISLTYETSRGCYWSKCAYCVDLPLPKPSYRRKDPRLVTQDMKRLQERYGAGHLLFGDPGLSPRQMREISDNILAEGVDIGWWTMARLDPGFSRELFGLAHKAGLRQVNFGFESANDRVCKLLDKGNERERSSRIIKACAASGIKVDLQTMLGLPGETFEEGLETVDFLAAHKRYIFDVTFNIYYLTPFNHIHAHPEKYGISYDKAPEMPFRFFIPFRNIRGMDMEKALMLEKICLALMPKEKKQTAAGEASEGCVKMDLLGESCTVRYLRDTATERYTFIEDGVERTKTREAACSTT